jgi:hypothetical protein
MDDLLKRFTYHAPKGNQAQRYEKMREWGLHVASFIQENCPDSREKSLAITKLEEAIMWANASIARNE